LRVIELHKALYLPDVLKCAGQPLRGTLLLLLRLLLLRLLLLRPLLLAASLLLNSLRHTVSSLMRSLPWPGTCAFAHPPVLLFPIPGALES
jgi:hypothetical protein